MHYQIKTEPAKCQPNAENITAFSAQICVKYHAPIISCSLWWTADLSRLKKKKETVSLVVQGGPCMVIDCRVYKTGRQELIRSSLDIPHRHVNTPGDDVGLQAFVTSR